MNRHRHSSTGGGSVPSNVQPVSTECDVPVPSPAALNPEQQRVAVLFTAGKDVNEVAEALGVHRSTLWHWRKLPTFEAYLNGLLLEMQTHARAGLFALYGDALAAIRRVLTTDTSGHALKAALFVLEHVTGRELGETDPRAIVRAQCTTNVEDVLSSLCDSTFDEPKYRRCCKELGIEP